MPKRARRKVSESKSVLARVMMPQDANNLGNVFGGTILNLVDEIAYVAATRHCHKPAVTASVDRMAFLSPVRIGDLVTLHAMVNAAWHTSMEVGVSVTAEDMNTGEVRHTGSSYVTVVALDRNGKPTLVPELVLETEDDARRNREANLRRERRLKEIAGERRRGGRRAPRG